MADLLFSNNASALLNTTISNIDTTIEVAAGFGALFPSPSGSQYFLAALEDNAGNFEVVRCTSRTGDLLTVVRGQDNTTAQAFTQNVTRVELRLTAAVIAEMVQVNGDVMLGDLDMNGNNLVNAVLTGASTQITAGAILGVPIRGSDNGTANEIVVPAAGAAPTIGGSVILKAGDDVVAELDTAGVILLDSATIGVRIPTNAYLRIEASASQYVQVDHDGTDVNTSFVGSTVDWNISGLTGKVILSNTLDMNDSNLERADLLDFSMVRQAVTATTTTAINYSLGSYVALALSTSITSLSFTNPPASGSVGVLRLQITQGTGGQTITWPASVRWPGGVAPTLSTGAGDVDFVDLWTPDGGTNWYGSFNYNWS